MKLDDIRNAYISEGIGYLDAGSRASHDVVLSLIARASITEHVTIKGGVVMQYITGSSRRATTDLDLDFIRYSLNEETVKSFVDRLSNQSDNISIDITAPIEELKHQDYKGLRAYIRITDSDGTSIETKLDIGVHKDVSMEQMVYCFDLGKLDDSVSLLVNSKEQIFLEKLKSLLRLGVFTTRFKDIFDMFWLVSQGDLNKTVLLSNIESAIFNDSTMRENSIEDISIRLNSVLWDPRFINALAKSNRYNWLGVEIQQVADMLLNFFREF